MGNFLGGYKTYIIGALMVLVSGLYAMGYITEATYKVIEGILLGGGLATLRKGSKDDAVGVKEEVTEVKQKVAAVKSDVAQL